MIPLVRVVFHMGYKSTAPPGTVLWKCSLRNGESARDDRQRDPARVLLAVVDRLVRDDALLPSRRRDHPARVRVAIEAREVARRDLDPNLMPRPEQVARRPAIDLEPLTSPGVINSCCPVPFR